MKKLWLLLILPALLVFSGCATKPDVGDRTADAGFQKEGGNSVADTDITAIVPASNGGTNLGSSALYWGSAYIQNLFSSSSLIDILTVATDIASPLLVGDGTNTSTLASNYLRIGTTSGYNVGKFAVDTSGNVNASGTLQILPALTAASTSTIGGFGITPYTSHITLMPTTAKYVRIGDAGITSQALAANDDLLVSGKLEVNGNTYLDGPVYISANGFSVATNGYVSFQTAPDDTSSGFYSVGTGNTNLNLWLGSALGRNLVIGEAAARGTNFDHTSQTNPTLWLHSATHPDVDNRQYVGWVNKDIGDGLGFQSYHQTGTGGHRFGFDALADNGTITCTNQPSAGESFVINATTFTEGVTWSIGASLSVTLDNIVTAINASVETYTAHKYGSTVVIENDNVGVYSQVFTETLTNCTASGSGLFTGGRAFSTGYQLQETKFTVAEGVGFGISTSTPRAQLHITQGASGIGTTSTVWVGDLGGVKGQYCMGDSDGAGASCMYMNNGVVYGYVTTTYAHNY